MKSHSKSHKHKIPFAQNIKYKKCKFLEREKLNTTIGMHMTLMIYL
jgi:hypothetical protein